MKTQHFHDGNFILKLEEKVNLLNSKIKFNLKLIQYLYLFLSFQIINISIFLFNKSEKINLEFDVYLNFIKYTTIIMLILGFFYFIQNYKQLLKNFNIVTITSTSVILTLYFTMIIHTDKLAIGSPTIFLMLVLLIIFSIIRIDFDQLLKFIFSLSIINTFFVILQIYKLIPIAQENIRESIFDIGNRPTGIFFNAFAMGYAMSICFVILAYQIMSNKYKLISILGASLSLISLVLSGTRTSLVLTLFLTIIIYIFRLSKSVFFRKIGAMFISILVGFSPILIILFGKIVNNDSLIGLNGRTLLWNCVLNRWLEFIPFGVGVQAAFPQGFCSDDIWFSKLRHPENMFLLTFVEAGLIGILTLVFFFLVNLKISIKAIEKNNYLPWAITTIYLLSSVFYVPLFHYLPFLPNRTADRGIFNFFIMTLIWIIVLHQSLNYEKHEKKPIDYKSS